MSDASRRAPGRDAPGDIGLPRLIIAFASMALVGAGPSPGTGARPTLQAQRDLWEGGGWKQDFAHGGGFLSGYPTDDEYMNLNYVPPNPIPLSDAMRRQDLHIRDQLAKGHSIFAPYSECHPPGIPYIFTMDGYGGWNAVVGKQEIIFFYPNNYFREIFTDGRHHLNPKTVKPTYLGDSIGWWEGGTFIVDTVNVRGSNIQYEPYVPEREGSHVVERYTPVKPGELKLRITITNPDFTRAWVVDQVLTRDPADKMRQGLCTDENRYRMKPGEGLVLQGSDGKPLEKAED